MSEVREATSSRQDRLADQLRQVDEYFQQENAHDLGSLMAIFGAQPCFALNGRRIDGHAEISSLYAELVREIRGVRFELLHRYVADDVVIADCRLTGAHVGVIQGRPPVGGHIETPAYAVFRFDAAGRLAGETIYFDAARLLQQLAPLRQAA